MLYRTSNRSAAYGEIGAKATSRDLECTRPRLYFPWNAVLCINRSPLPGINKNHIYLRNASRELEGTVSANWMKNNVGDTHGDSVGTSSIRERASDNFRSVHTIAH